MKLKKLISILLSVLLIVMTLPLNILAEEMGIETEQIVQEEQAAMNHDSVDEDVDDVEDKTETAGTQAVELINGANLETQGTVNIADWSYTNNNGVVILTAYNGTSTDVVIPANRDFGGNVTEVHIGKSAMQSAAKGATNLSISGNGNKVIAIDSNWHSTFMNYKIIESIDLSNLDTGNIVYMGAMFCSCTSLKELNLNEFNTSQVTNMSAMFHNCSSLECLDLHSFNTDLVPDMAHMFDSCSSLVSLDLSSFNTSLVTDMSWMFSNCSSLKSLNFNNFDTSLVTDMSYMFRNCSVLEILDLSNFNTDMVRDMSWMFYGCASLIDLDMSNFNTHLVRDMSWMFHYCKLIPSLNLDGFQTDNVTKMPGMFGYCSSLTKIDLCNFDTKAVKDMSYLFVQCSNLKKIQVGSSWTTLNINNSEAMFSGCEVLTGGLGTKYDYRISDAQYARIDGGPNSDTPGYLTYKNVAVKSISLSVSTMKLNLGETSTLTATILPKTADDLSITWSSSNESVATVENGTIKASSEHSGTAVITAQTSNRDIYAICKVTVVNPVQGISLSDRKITIGVGQCVWIQVKFQPWNADNKKIFLSSDAENIAIVEKDDTQSDGLCITGINVGSAKITVKTEDGNYEASCEVTVINASDEKDWTYVKLTNTDQLAALNHSSIDRFWFGRHDVPSNIPTDSTIVYAYNSQDDYYAVTYLKEYEKVRYWGRSGDGAPLQYLIEEIDAGKDVYLVYEHALGDINADGAINSTDALQALRHSVKEITLVDDAFTRGDVVTDGVINSTDALQILRYSVKEITSFD